MSLFIFVNLDPSPLAKKIKCYNHFSVLDSLYLPFSCLQVKCEEFAHLEKQAEETERMLALYTQSAGRSTEDEADKEITAAAAADAIYQVFFTLHCLCLFISEYLCLQFLIPDCFYTIREF